MKKYGLLGERLEHSFSPQIHAMLADYEYKLYEVPPGDVAGFIERGGFNGLNVTVPYKKTVLPLCHTLSGAAERIGSVNTIIRRGDGSLHGDNTDFYGFSYLLEKIGVDVTGKKAIILGDGGTAATVRCVLGDLEAGEVVTISRRGPDNYNNISKNADARIIVNTTPVGMYPGNTASPVSLDIFSSCEAVLDVIYNPAKTELMLQAADRGIPCAGGLNMLVAQAARACELFIGKEISAPAIDSIVEAIRRQTMNIAIIGMPGCGKTSVGRRLAEITGRKFYDIDELIAHKAGKAIERIFAEDGEEAFRNLEADILFDISKKSGGVIATGGGVVKIGANRRLLSRNSVVVFLDRAPEMLPVDGRPLSLAFGVQALYAERLPLYEEWCDHRVGALDGVEPTAQAVMEILSL